MCTINRHGDCINNYCSCSSAHWPTPGGWLTYDIYERTICNRIIGYFINLFRKPSIYEEEMTDITTGIKTIIDEISIVNLKQKRKSNNMTRAEKTHEIRRKYGLIDDEDNEEYIKK